MRIISAAPKLVLALAASFMADGGAVSSDGTRANSSHVASFLADVQQPASTFGKYAEELAQKAPPTLRRPGSIHEFYFTRAIYGSGIASRWTPSWATDYPKADLQFLIGLKRLTNVDAYDFENAIELDDPDLRRYPFLYALEVGYMGLTDSEVKGLRSYLLAGGFLMIDDFWGTWQWQNFEMEMQRVLPGYPHRGDSHGTPYLFDVLQHRGDRPSPERGTWARPVVGPGSTTAIIPRFAAYSTTTVDCWWLSTGTRTLVTRGNGRMIHTIPLHSLPTLTRWALTLFCMP